MYDIYIYASYAVTFVPLLVLIVSSYRDLRLAQRRVAQLTEPRASQENRRDNN